MDYDITMLDVPAQPVVSIRGRIAPADALQHRKARGFHHRANPRQQHLSPVCMA